MTLITSIERRFENIENNNLYIFSTIIDPRFKGKGLKNDLIIKKALIDIKKEIINIFIKDEAIIPLTNLTIPLK